MSAHTRTKHETGPDYCAECSAAALDWVVWSEGHAATVDRLNEILLAAEVPDACCQELVRNVPVDRADKHRRYLAASLVAAGVTILRPGDTVYRQIVHVDGTCKCCGLELDPAGDCGWCG